MPSPQCAGSGLTTSPDGNYVAICPHCRHHVRVTNGKTATHWWSKRAAEKHQ